MELTQLTLVTGWIALHIGGLCLGWATRLATSTGINWVIQISFFSILAALAGVAWFSHQLELGLWIPTGFIMVLMVLTAVADFDPLRNDDPRHATPVGTLR